MRLLIFVLAALIWCAPAQAQKPPPQGGSPSRPSVQAPPPSEAEAVAARTMLNAFVIESGILDAVLDQAVAEELPQLRAATNDPALLAEIGPERQARVRAFMDTLPIIVREEVERTIPVAIESSLPAIAQLFTEDEMEGIADFLRRDRTRDLLRRMVRDESDVTYEDMAMMEQFGRTRAGRAFIRHGEAMFSLLQAALEQATPAMVATLTQRVYAGMCEALGESCPPEIREQIAPI